MKIEQKKWTEQSLWEHIGGSLEKMKEQIVLAFGDRLLLSNPKRYEELKLQYPNGDIVLISTAGNILNIDIDDKSIVTIAIAFEYETKIEVKQTTVKKREDCYSAGEFIGKSFQKEGLVHILLFSDGHVVNASEVLRGFLKEIPPKTTVSGGLAGDYFNFERTLIGLNAPPSEGKVVGIGFYGAHLRFGIGSAGGWDPFGVERVITKSTDNILYEMDDKSALDLYKVYLGEMAKTLPRSALFFPLAIRKDLESHALVRTILNIDENDKSMIFAGDVPEGWRAQLMKASFDRLIDGARLAAQSSVQITEDNSVGVAILVSCVGRRLVMAQRTEEELEVVQDVIGKNIPMIGFYSYGEIAPSLSGKACELHNQTMTITTISEF